MSSSKKPNTDSSITNYYIRESHRSSVVLTIITIAFIAIMHHRLTNIYNKIEQYHEEMHSMLSESLQQNTSLEKTLLKIENKLDQGFFALHIQKNHPEPQVALDQKTSSSD